MGRTMDLEAPVDYNIIYLPQAYPIADNLLGGHFESTYKIMGVGFKNCDPLKDGINEHGLIGITNDFGGFNLYHSKVDPDKTNLSSYHLMNYLLGNCRNVAEVLDLLPSLHIATHNALGEKVISPIFHFMFSDGDQNCIVIEPHKGQLKVYPNPYQVMTNAPAFPSHERHLLKIMDPSHLEGFNGAKDLPGAYDPKSRFVKAYYLSQLSIDNSSADKAMANLLNVLSSVSLPKGFIPNQKYHSYTYTLYQSAYDTWTKQLLIRVAENPMPYTLSFEAITDPDQRQAFYIPSTLGTQAIY